VILGVPSAQLREHPVQARHPVQLAIDPMGIHIMPVRHGAERATPEVEPRGLQPASQESK
jgi:hypothetical protein